MKLDAAQRTAMENDSRYQDIGQLPSNFYGYSFKNLLIRPFTVKELRLVGKAGLTGEDRHFIRAVDLCISEEAEELTLGDYYYILLWLKVHSSPKTPYVIDWTCPATAWKRKDGGDTISNKNFVEPPKEEHGLYTVEKCDTKNTELIHMTSVEILQLPETGWEGLPKGFDFPRVKHLVDIQTMLKDEELAMIAPGAQWVAGETMADKVAILEAQSDTDMFLEAMALNESIVHGISEETTLHCRDCRAEFPYTINLEPKSFFR